MESRVLESQRAGRGGRQNTLPEWASTSRSLAKGFSLARRAHDRDRRPVDGRLFIEHVTEVAALLQRLDFDEELIVVGLLHDSVERGRLAEAELRSAVGDGVCSLVLTLSEDSSIHPLETRKRALREQVANGGIRAVTVFAADKLSDIAGLRRRIESLDQASRVQANSELRPFATHYCDSVEMIASVRPGSIFLPALRRELRRLEETISV